MELLGGRFLILNRLPTRLSKLAQAGSDSSGRHVYDYATALHDIGKVCRDAGVLLYCDATASIAGNHLLTDDWMLDVVVLVCKSAFVVPQVVRQ